MPCCTYHLYQKLLKLIGPILVLLSLSASKTDLSFEIQTRDILYLTPILDVLLIFFQRCYMILI